MGEIIDRATLRIRMRWNRITGRVGFKPNTDQIAEAHSTLDALKRAWAINDYQYTGLRNAVYQTEVRDSNINVGALSRIGSQRIQDLYRTLTSSQNRGRLSEDDLGALQYAARLAQEAEAQAPKHNSTRRYNIRGLIRGGLIIAGVAFLGTELAIAFPPSPEPPPRLPEAIIIKDLTTEPTPKSPRGLSVRLTDPNVNYEPGNSNAFYPRSSEHTQYKPAKNQESLSYWDDENVKLVLHQNPDGSLIPAVEMDNAIDYKTARVRWLIRDHNRIFTIQGKWTNNYQALVISRLTLEERDRVLVDEAKKARDSGFTLDAYLRNNNTVFLMRSYIRT